VNREHRSTALSWRQKGEIALEAAIQALPYVGGPLATLYFSAKQERGFNRLITWYRELAAELEALKEKIPPIGAHNQEALEAIIETLNEKVEREHLVEKRKMLKNYLKTTLFHPIVTTEDYDERKFFLETLDGMTLFESQILGQVYLKPDGVSFQHLRPTIVDQYVLRGAVGRLESYGFI
jgi:hypothetical protein